MPSQLRKVRKRMFDGRETAPCFWCLDPLTLNNSTIDHVIGKGEGGQLTHLGQCNVVLSCEECNNLRSVLQNILRTKQTLQNAVAKWPALTRAEVAVKVRRLRSYLKIQKPALDAAEQAFQDRCKIKLCKGTAGVIYPVDPVPDLPKVMSHARS